MDASVEEGHTPLGAQGRPKQIWRRPESLSGVLKSVSRCLEVVPLKKATYRWSDSKNSEQQISFLEPYDHANRYGAVAEAHSSVGSPIDPEKNIENWSTDILRSDFQTDLEVVTAQANFFRTSLEYILHLQRVQEGKKTEFVETVNISSFLGASQSPTV